MDESTKKKDDIVQLARLALSGRPQDIQTYIRRLARRYQGQLPHLASELSKLLQESPTRQSPLRRQVAAPVPVDLESRLQLLRIEDVPSIDVEPIWEPSVQRFLEQILSERRHLCRVSGEHGGGAGDERLRIGVRRNLPCFRAVRIVCLERELEASRQ